MGLPACLLLLLLLQVSFCMGNQDPPKSSSAGCPRPVVKQNVYNIKQLYLESLTEGLENAIQESQKKNTIAQNNGSQINVSGIKEEISDLQSAKEKVQSSLNEVLKEFEDVKDQQETLYRNLANFVDFVKENNYVNYTKLDLFQKEIEMWVNFRLEALADKESKEAETDDYFNVKMTNKLMSIESQLNQIKRKPSCKCPQNHTIHGLQRNLKNKIDEVEEIVKDKMSILSSQIEEVKTQMKIPEEEDTFKCLSCNKSEEQAKMQNKIDAVDNNLNMLRSKMNNIEINYRNTQNRPSCACLNKGVIEDLENSLGAKITIMNITLNNRINATEIQFWSKFGALQRNYNEKLRNAENRFNNRINYVQSNTKQKLDAMETVLNRRLQAIENKQQNPAVSVRLLQKKVQDLTKSNRILRDRNAIQTKDILTLQFEMKKLKQTFQDLSGNFGMAVDKMRNVNQRIAGLENKTENIKQSNLRANYRRLINHRLGALERKAEQIKGDIVNLWNSWKKQQAGENRIRTNNKRVTARTIWRVPEMRTTIEPTVQPQEKDTTTVPVPEKQFTTSEDIFTDSQEYKTAVYKEDDFVENRKADSVRSRVSSEHLLRELSSNDSSAEKEVQGPEVTTPTEATEFIQANVFLPADCLEIYNLGPRANGIYWVQPPGSNPFQVFCEMTSGGWTILMSRFDGSQEFYQSWEKYKKGFGNLTQEHWLGNEKIHHITKNKNYRLKVDIVQWRSGKSRFAVYEKFRVDSEKKNYKLHVSEYSGNASDYLSYNDQMEFSTRDKDHDRWSGVSCARQWKGGFWYHNCGYSNPTGLYKAVGLNGVNWYYSVSQITFKIKPTG